MKAFCPRGLAACSASASRPLPVPVSPSSSTLESAAATRGSMAKIRRIAVDWPTISPKWVSLLMGWRTGSARVSKISTVVPRRSSAPDCRYAVSILTPFTNVPLRLPRSRKR